MCGCWTLRAETRNVHFELITLTLSALTLLVGVERSHAQNLQDDRPRAEIALSDDTLQRR